MSNPKVDMPESGNMQKDPENWVTGDEPMTGAQDSERIDALRDKHPRLNPKAAKKRKG